MAVGNYRKQNRSTSPGRLLVAAALSLAALSACSAEEAAAPLPSIPATTPALTRDDFSARANKVCVDAEKRIVELTNANGPINNQVGAASDADLRKLVDAIRPVGQNAIDQLKSLTPPPEDAASVQAGIAQMQSVLDEAQKDVRRQLDPIGQINKTLYDYGLISCFSRGSG